MQFAMPDAGEGLTEAEIIRWLVHAGDQVAVNDAIVEIETAKSLVEIPCPVAGVVAKLLFQEGETVPVGTPIISITEAGAEPERAPAPVPESESGPASERLPVLVGYGPRRTAARSRRRPPSAPSSTAAVAHPTSPVSATATPVARPLTKPPIRKLVRDLGVDLRLVIPTGPGGIITRDDVTAAARALKEPQQQPETQADPGRETRTPIRGVRRATAEAMVASAFTAPHVTTWVTTDVTRSLKLIARAKQARQQALSPLVLVIRALLIAVRRHPEINASWDERGGEIVTKHYVNVGIAATTPRGLLVPVIRDAGTRSLDDLTSELARLISAARDGSATPADLQGGTISITNIGVFGVDGGTPILPPGQAAILGAGRIATRPWVHRGKVRPRSVMQLTLSFDHRLVDGDLGSRFLADVAAVLENPDLALLWN